MPNKEPYPKPRKIKPQPAKGPRKPRGKMSPEREMPKRNPNAIVPKPAKRPKIDRDLRDMREMPKRVKPRSGTKGSFDDAVRTQNNQRKILGSTKAQRAAYALDMMNDMRSRNILRAKKGKKSNG